MMDSIRWDQSEIEPQAVVIFSSHHPDELDEDQRESVEAWLAEQRGW